MIAGLVLLCLAAASGPAETILYGRRPDENNVIQESFFLPLTFTLGFFGILLVAVSLLLKKR